MLTYLLTYGQVLETLARLKKKIDLFHLHIIYERTIFIYDMCYTVGEKIGEKLTSGKTYVLDHTGGRFYTYERCDRINALYCLDQR